jgi:hypothetical protein
MRTPLPPLTRRSAPAGLRVRVVGVGRCDEQEEALRLKELVAEGIGGR